MLDLGQIELGQFSYFFRTMPMVRSLYLAPFLSGDCEMSLCSGVGNRCGGRADWRLMAPSCWAFFLEFCLKLSWAGVCDGVMEGGMLGVSIIYLDHLLAGSLCPFMTEIEKWQDGSRVGIGLRTVWSNNRENMV